MGDELFGYDECEKGVSFAAQTQPGSTAVRRQIVYMQDVMRMDVEEHTGAQPKAGDVFRME